ncbi:MAG: 30S ribosomal protein S18 [Candidatus Magasanikbacteria bacterium CG10_big_fil_rev_8_21_14_0_10_47_10]|uniref:Small ribosomal subunit protein bS18 n=1 Tax=Candidatus Magasanikbacteria bacterium CG10_big_fil_rev_8_21_14_0_10_47_10 TaxID=1974652 RepID=A0A2H0TR57_9BACT|nr:MAG: 30S ribosomal protein S18 [Candidatus Magasanikbacteria bacterium CG10_big_fil_rev_8_21_14_0_10_47_10]
MKKKSNKHCYYCANDIPSIDYKDAVTLRRFTSSFMKIAPRRRSGLCALHQRKAARAIKQARIAGLLAFTAK